MSFFITFYVPFEMSWKGFISDKAEGSGRCVTLAVPIKLQIFFFLLLNLRGEKKAQWELVFLFTIFYRGNQGKISSVFVRINDRRNLIYFLLWAKHKYYKSEDKSVDLCSKNMTWNNLGECTGVVYTSEYPCNGLILSSRLLDDSSLAEVSLISFTWNKKSKSPCLVLARGPSSFRKKWQSINFTLTITMQLNLNPTYEWWHHFH